MLENCSRCGVQPYLGCSNTGWDGKAEFWQSFYTCPKCNRSGPWINVRTAEEAARQWNERQRIISEAYKANPPKMTTVDASAESGNKSTISQQVASFCRACGASIPHRIGEGRCPECMHHLPKPEAEPR